MSLRKAALKETTRMKTTIFILLLFIFARVPLAAGAGSVYLPLIIRTQTQTLQNGDFEKGPDGSWKEASSNAFSLILTGGDLQGLVPQGGSWAVWMGGDNNETSRLSQTIYVPDQATTLNYYYWIESYELPENCSFDSLVVSLGGTTHKTYALCEPNNTNQWVLGQIDLVPFRGKIGELVFELTNDDVDHSNFFLDSISISTLTGQ
jgi:hypothetical protein